MSSFDPENIWFAVTFVRMSSQEYLHQGLTYL
jgi:hypothetical protein